MKAKGQSTLREKIMTQLRHVPPIYFGEAEETIKRL
jgi:hypothetical protein